MEPKLIRAQRVIWEKNFHQDVCAHVPFDGTKCLTLTAGVRIIEDSGKYYIELQLMGNRIQYEIGNVCYPVYSIGIGSLTVCTSDLKTPGGKLAGLTITVKGCVGGSVGPIHLEKCWDLLNQTLTFLYLSEQMKGINNEPIVANYNDIVYYEKENA